MRAILALVASLAAGCAAFAAMPEEPPREDPPPKPATSAPTPVPTPAEAPKPADPKDDGGKRSSSGFRDGFAAALSLLRENRFAEARVALLALDRDDLAEVANLVGFASRKLGDYDAARDWYERALAIDPAHVRTWQYYGLWHIERGNRLKGEEHLEKVRALCGEDCADTRALKAALEGNIVY